MSYQGLRLVSKEDVIWEFPAAANHINRALERGSQYTIEEIMARLVSGRLQLWLYGQQAALVTSLIGERCLLLCCAGQRMRDWLGCLAFIEGWARVQGCHAMVLHGRKGWSRLLNYHIEGTDDIGLTVMSKSL